ncbi:ZU5 domain-containing protein [Chryseolinea serpens]|uniref:ZU5 domain-containing protein n=1 Tax=Chryseolinea serpens TaxID=947013 RepID=A0A1M5TTE5_9BACT|nr:hypothetical protein [Chryseolinea serpens]SHH53910.1 ZU5 domain-containing protein [Chryseolinea serpens]
MKTFRVSTSTSPRLRTGCAWMFTLAMVLASCSDADNPSPSPQHNDPVITGEGTPNGEPTSALIGAQGGSLSASDGQFTLTVPAGALSANTNISIQPITNEGPLGVGAAYRLQPEGLTFAVPVKLTFSYTTEMLTGIPEDFLWIITQADDGSWNALLKSEVNAAAKTVSVATTHFSDWAAGKFIDLSLTPASTKVMKGDAIQLIITGFSPNDEEDELVPLAPITSESDDLVPLTRIPPVESRMMTFKVKEWTLNGSAAPVSNSNGQLESSKNTATYTAPDKIPSVNPVAVSVELEASNKEGRKLKYLLTSNITVVDSDLYLSVTVDGQTHVYYQYGYNGTIPPNGNDISIANSGLSDEDVLEIVGTRVEGSINLIDGFALAVKSPTKGTRSLVCFNNDGDDDMSFAIGQQTGYLLSYTKRTPMPNDYCDTEYMCGETSITFLEDPKDEEGYVRGSFSGKLYEDKTEFGISCQSPIEHAVSGEFRLVRAN